MIDTEQAFYELDEAVLDAASFRYVQTELLEMNNEQLSEALGWPDRERGRKIISRMRKGDATVSPPIVTLMWLMVFGTGERPAWMPEALS